MSEKLFILGVGAQKSGTTWLHRYLQTNANVDMGPIKEYHVWDAINQRSGSGNAVTTAKISMVARASDTIMGWLGKPNKIRIRENLREDTERYFDFFEKQLRKKGVDITGDISPSYSGLPPELLGQIKAGFAKRNIEVRVVFLMRDPVERLWSAVRMNVRREAKNGIGQKQDEESNLREVFRNPKMKLLGNYHDTILNLEKVFAKESIYVGIYETMFDAPELERLSGFLRVPTRHRFTKRKVNSGGEKQAVSPDLAQEIRAEYNAVYQFCGLRYPETKHLWRY